MISPKELGLEAGEDGDVFLNHSPLKLAPKERAVLHMLIRSWPAAVSKASFASQIWKGAMSDESLVRSVAQIRQALTVAKRIKVVALYGKGYQLQIISIKSSRSEGTAMDSGYFEDALAESKTAEAVRHSKNLIHQRTTSAMQRAETLLRKIIEEQPECQPARRAFAECISAQVSCGWGLRRSNIQEALDVLEKIPKAFRPGSGYYSEKAHLLDCAWEFDEARLYHAQAREFEQRDPATHYHYGWHLLARNEPLRAIEALNVACDLVPFSPALSIMLARAYTFTGQTDRGMAIMRQAVIDHPGNAMVYVYSLTYEALLEPGRDLATRLLELGERDLAWSFAPSSVVYALARCGEMDQAQTLLDAHAHHNPSMRATFTSGMLVLGKVDEALNYLSEAAALGCGFLPISLRAPENRSLAGHQAYERVVAKVFARL